MGKMKDLFVSGVTNEEMNIIINKARNQWDDNYIAFLEEQIEIKDRALKEIKLNLNKMENILNNNKKETS